MLARERYCAPRGRVVNRFGSWGLIAILSTALPAAALAQNGTIAGTVTRSDNLQPITTGTVILYAASDFSDVASTQLNENGQYLFNVAPGDYAVLVDAPTYAGEFYDNVPCISADLCDPGDATVIALGSSQLKVANFALDPLGTISGTVRRSDTNALVPGISVVAFDNGADPIASATTDATGAYTLYVYDGSFSVRTRNTTYLLDEIWNNVPCNITGCNTGAATLIQVQNAGSVTGKDFVLAPGSPVSGTVRRAGNLPMDETARVEFSDAQGNIVANIATDLGGNWQLPFAAATGSWRAVAYSLTESRYFPQVYSGRPCVGANQDLCDAAAGDPIVVTVPTPVTNVDFALTRRTALLTGNIREFGGGPANLIDAGITAYDADTLEFVKSSSTVSGTPYILELEPGRYVLYASPPLSFHGKATPPIRKHLGEALLGEVYPGLQCFEQPPACGSPATVLTLEADQDLDDIDFALAPPGHVTVSLRNADTNALMSGAVKLLHPGTTEPLTNFVLSAAPIELPVLNGGNLRLAGIADNCGPGGQEPCLGRRYPNDVCPGMACDLTQGGPAGNLALAKGGDAGSVELTLAPGRHISGTVRSAVDQVGIPDVTVEFNIGDVLIATTTTASDGSYDRGGLGFGPYFVRTHAPTGFLDEVYDNLPCVPGSCNVTTGTSLGLDVDKSGIDFSLAPGAGIRGSVTNAQSNLPVLGAIVDVFNAGGVKVATASTLSNGTYATAALPPGNYFVAAGRSGYAPELYQELACPGGVCAPLSGTTVVVSAPDDTLGIDFTLTPDPGLVPPRGKIYLNRCAQGCTVTPGQNSSINNTSPIVSQTSNVTGFGGTNAAFDQFVACMEDMYAPFNVDVLTQDPGPVMHKEVMIGKLPGEIGLPAGVAGVSPFTCGDIPNAIVFAFGEAQDPQRLCETAAQELGHSTGLDHLFYCPDPMTYLEGCGPKRFQNVDSPCGEYAPRPCTCGGETQSAFRRIELVAGITPAIFKDGFEEPPAPPAAKSMQETPRIPFQCGTKLEANPLEYRDEFWRPRWRP